MEEKQVLRQWVRRHWAAVSEAERAKVSERIMGRLENLPAFAAAKTAALFWPMPHEVDTRPAIRKWYGNKRILLPVMQNRHLLLCPFTSEHDLIRHPSGVWEPAGCTAVPLTEVGLIVVPGAAFDPEGGRAGWGGGYYDRLLATAPAVLPKIGVCFDFQFFSTVPREPHDILLDGVIVGSDRDATLYISSPNGKS